MKESVWSGCTNIPLTIYGERKQGQIFFSCPDNWEELTEEEQDLKIRLFIEKKYAEWS